MEGRVEDRVSAEDAHNKMRTPEEKHDVVTRNGTFIPSKNSRAGKSGEYLVGIMA